MKEFQRFYALLSEYRKKNYWNLELLITLGTNDTIFQNIFILWLDEKTNTGYIKNELQPILQEIAETQ